MDQSILTVLKPIADSLGLSMAWIEATALNVVLGTGLVKQAFGVRRDWNLLTAGVIAAALAGAQYYATPITAVFGAALVFASTALALKLTGVAGSKLMKPLAKPDTRSDGNG